MYNDSRQKDFFWGAVIGGTVAVLTSLLFTTKKGKQIQRQIVEAYEDLEESVCDQLCDVKEKIEDGAEHLSKKFKDKFDDSVDQASKKAKEKIDEGADYIHKKTDKR